MTCAHVVSVDGSPATAARVGLERTVPRVPDLVVSGINRGENLGMSVYLSGTLGAAREAAFAGVPAIAVSIMGNRPETYAAAATATRALVDDLRARQLLKAGLFVNVNVPAGPVKGTKLAPLSLRASRVEHQCSPPMRERVACFPVFRQTLKDEPGTDIGEFYQGFITVTPMALLMTSLAAPAASAGMPVGRVLDTILGAALGIVAAVVFSSVDDRVHLHAHRSRER